MPDVVLAVGGIQAEARSGINADDGDEGFTLLRGEDGHEIGAFPGVAHQCTPDDLAVVPAQFDRIPGLVKRRGFVELLAEQLFGPDLVPIEFSAHLL